MLPKEGKEFDKNGPYDAGDTLQLELKWDVKGNYESASIQAQLPCCHIPFTAILRERKRKRGKLLSPRQGKGFQLFNAHLWISSFPC